MGYLTEREASLSSWCRDTHPVDNHPHSDSGPQSAVRCGGTQYRPAIKNLGYDIMQLTADELAKQWQVCMPL